MAEDTKVGFRFFRFRGDDQEFNYIADDNAVANAPEIALPEIAEARVFEALENARTAVRNATERKLGLDVDPLDPQDPQADAPGWPGFSDVDDFSFF